MIRFVIGVLFVVLYCIFSVPVLIVATIVRKFAPLKAEMAMLRIVQWAFRVLLFICGTKVEATGLENVPDDEAVLFVGNHQSYFDIIISYSLMKGRCGYVAKKNLEHVPLLSWNMKFLFCLFIDRDDIKQGLQTILKAIDYVKNGISVFIFPEGTRNKGDETQLQPFHKGSFKIAQRTNCKIIPVAFHNTSVILEKNFPIVTPTTVRLKYGSPIPYDSLTKDEQKRIDEVFREKITEMLLEIQ